MHFNKSGGSENLRFDKDLKPLTNLDLEELVNVLKIKNFREIFMINTEMPYTHKQRLDSSGECEWE